MIGVLKNRKLGHFVFLNMLGIATSSHTSCEHLETKHKPIMMSLLSKYYSSQYSKFS